MGLLRYVALRWRGVGNLALRTGKTTDRVPESLTARGCPEAEPFNRRAYRSGW